MPIKLRISGLFATAAFAVACLFGGAQTLAQNAYITNSDSKTVSVIATATNTVTATIPVGNLPEGVAVTPDGSNVANFGDSTMSVIAAASNTVTATIPVAVTPSAWR